MSDTGHPKVKPFFTDSSPWAVISWFWYYPFPFFFFFQAKHSNCAMFSDEYVAQFVQAVKHVHLSDMYSFQLKLTNACWLISGWWGWKTSWKQEAKMTIKTIVTGNKTEGKRKGLDLECRAREKDGELEPSRLQHQDTSQLCSCGNIPKGSLLTSHVYPWFTYAWQKL